jgi:hypothetical protein
MTSAELSQQFDLALEMARVSWRAAPAVSAVHTLRAALKDRLAKGVTPVLTTAINDLDQLAAVFESTAAPGSASNLARLSSQAVSLLGDFEGADMPPTAQAIAAARSVASSFAAALAAWEKVRDTDIPALNVRLKTGHLTPIDIRR